MLSKQQCQSVFQRRENIKQVILKKRYGRDWKTKQHLYHPTPAELFAEAQLETLGGNSILTEANILRELAHETGFPFRHIDPLKLEESLVTRTLTRPFATRYGCIPVEQTPGESILFATDNPFQEELHEALRSLLRVDFSFVIAPKADIQQAITEMYGFRHAVKAAAEDITLSVEIGNLEQLIQLRDVEDIEATDQHVVKAVDYILRYALQQGASDIHIEPKRTKAHIRFRIDGILHSIYRLPRSVHQAVCSRIKMLARMDIAERRRPQDGRIKTEWELCETEIRVSTLPVAFGEKIVLRILNTTQLFQDPSSLGLEGSSLQHFQTLLKQQTGMILVTGPTGSGKTTTLYSMLRSLATPERNVTTIEDPIEMVVDTYNQTMVQPKIGVTFANALRTVLRQDPDVIMIGEIRDPETAQMAVQAALTGHLVLATLHTNDAAGAVARLQDLGVPNFLLSSALLGVIAQRLLRKVCQICKAPNTLSDEQLSTLGIDPSTASAPLRVWEGTGCPRCRETGYAGRTGVFELLCVDRRIRSLIHNGSDANTIHQEAESNGMIGLRENAIATLARGTTSWTEVIRLFGEGEQAFT
jgi:general secretion pathway protein E